MLRRAAVIGLVLALGFSMPGADCTAAERLPNFVIIFIDDMGYADIGPFGAKGYATPNLDRMAQEGRDFTDFYVTQAVCSASRAGADDRLLQRRDGHPRGAGPPARTTASAPAR